ncbi:hypothetical protein [Actinomadura sp. NBRC 104425]|uniref:hypothetical protein n=1 Tax=Actinomadura sp. NBRC 104425 TaxID=3032204 RepID=UPI0025563DB3|nr:hypothetical protein [Actinomadura sp. NBRC 104425]
MATVIDGGRFGQVFPDWGISTDANPSAARRSLQPHGASTEVTTLDAGKLLDLLCTVAGSDDRHTLRVLRALLRQIGVDADGSTLTISHYQDIDAVVTRGGMPRREGRGIGTRTDLLAVAQWIVASLRPGVRGLLRRRDDDSEQIADAVGAVVDAELRTVPRAVGQQARRVLDRSAAQQTEHRAGTHDRPSIAPPPLGTTPDER